MGLPSKEERVLELFFNEPTKHWHFEDILKAAKTSRSKANKWLSKLAKEQIIQRIKPSSKMPYYQGYFDSPAYRNRKKLYALSKLYATGFLNHLLSLKKAKAIVIFGSFARADWYKGSDIDLFIYGDSEGLKTSGYSTALNREIQVFTADSASELDELGPGLLRNILEGILIKGKFDFVRVKPNAS
jgi:predicted nucleotidyltransferase